MASGETAPGPLAPLPVGARWALMLAISAVLAGTMATAGIPAALLMGPMVAGIVMALCGGTVRISRFGFLGAQAMIGCLVAGTITADIIATFLQSWPLFLSMVLAVVGASALLGFLMARWQVLPGTTAVWGSSPGAASAMMLMAEAFGADYRLVAFMQYLRVAFVATTASLIAHNWVGITGGSHPEIVWFPPIDAWPFAQTVALGVIGAWIGVRFKLPAGPLLVPLIGGALLHVLGLIQIELPEWLLAIGYALLGWRIGLGFTRPILVHASRAAPKIVLSILSLMAFSGVLALILHLTMGIDPLTAYLATSPGGMDSVAIIAASTNVDQPFVMAMQTIRFLIVLFTGPWLARVVARRVARYVAA